MAFKSATQAHHVQQMMVISSPLSGFLALWSSHCQVKIVPVGTIPPIRITKICCFLWHVEGEGGESSLSYQKARRVLLLLCQKRGREGVLCLAIPKDRQEKRKGGEGVCRRFPEASALTARATIFNGEL